MNALSIVKNMLKLNEYPEKKIMIYEMLDNNKYD